MASQDAASLQACPNKAIWQLSRAISALRCVLGSGEKLSAGHCAPSINNNPVNFSEVKAAFAEVVRTQTVLAPVKFEDLPEIRAVFPEYRQLLQQFKNEMPRFRGWLLAERVRLINRRTHSAKVGGWIMTNRQTR